MPVADRFESGVVRTFPTEVPFDCPPVPTRKSPVSSSNLCTISPSRVPTVREGALVGVDVGGLVLPSSVGDDVGGVEGKAVGTVVGIVDGKLEGTLEGILDGRLDGFAEGCPLGYADGTEVGLPVG